MQSQIQEPDLCKFWVCERENVTVPTPLYSLPEIEFCKARSQVSFRKDSQFAVKRSVTLRELQSLIGPFGHSRPRLFALHRSYRRRYMPPPSHSPFKQLRKTWFPNVATQIIVTERSIFFCQSYGTLYWLSNYIQMPWHQKGTGRYLESTAFYGHFSIAWHCLLK